MDKKYLKSHISNQFNRDMAKLLRMISEMGDLVSQQFDSTIVALAGNEEELLEDGHQQKVNALVASINSHCHQIISLRSPVATDLRMVIAILNAASEMEKVVSALNKFQEIDKFKETLKSEFISQVIRFSKDIKKRFVWSYQSLCCMDEDMAVKALVKRKKVKKHFHLLISQLNEISEAKVLKDIVKVLFSLEAVYNISKIASEIAKNAIYIEEGVEVLSADTEEIKRLVLLNTD